MSTSSFWPESKGSRVVGTKGSTGTRWEECPTTQFPPPLPRLRFWTKDFTKETTSEVTETVVKGELYVGSGETKSRKKTTRRRHIRRLDVVSTPIPMWKRFRFTSGTGSEKKDPRRVWLHLSKQGPLSRFFGLTRSSGTWSIKTTMIGRSQTVETVQIERLGERI